MEKITLKSITKAYGKNPPVIEDLNLGIEEGSFTVLLGPSGRSEERRVGKECRSRWSPYH